MKQNLIADYLSCIIFRAVSFFSYLLPKGAVLFIGAGVGDLLYFFDAKHRAVAQANIRKAFGAAKPYQEIAGLTRQGYRAFARNLFEIPLIPRIDKKYLNQYIEIQNRQFIGQAFKRGKGVVFLIVHEGNWELSNIICANLGFPFYLFVRDQGFPKLNSLLNHYRAQKGCKIIHKQAGLRDLIGVLKNNQSIGMTVDQGGKMGEIVNFFGRRASMAAGAVKLALKYDCAIIPVFYTRVKGLYTKVILDRVFTAGRSGNSQDDLKNNLQELMNIYEGYIRLYPYEYLWTYKIWKYGQERKILILSDKKAGHLKQSEGLSNIIARRLNTRGVKVELSVAEVTFKHKWWKLVFFLGVFLSGKYPSFKRLHYLSKAFSQDTQAALFNAAPDIVVSCGSGVCALNYIFSRLHQAKSIILMRPAAALGIKRFDLVVVPAHDQPAPKKNVVVTDGALNDISRELVSAKAQGLLASGLAAGGLSDFSLGVLIGGNSKGFVLDKSAVLEIIRQVKNIADTCQADLLITTSRRTAADIEELFRREFSNYARCKLLIIANQKNIPDAVAGILGLSKIIITTAESISMISEAASSGRYVLVCDSSGLNRRHRDFLNLYRRQKYIYLTKPVDLSKNIKELWANKPQIFTPQDDSKVEAALDKIL